MANHDSSGSNDHKNTDQGVHEQSEDILDEIVGNTSREPKRRKDKASVQEQEDDIFADFGDIDKSSSLNSREQRQHSPSPDTQRGHHSRHRSPSPDRPHKKIHDQRSSSPSSAQPRTSRSTHPSPMSPSSSPSGTGRHSSHSPSHRREIPSSLASLRNIVHYPTAGLYLGNLHWWTTDEDVKAPLAEGRLTEDLKDLIFADHKVNGKSKGICFLEFNSADAAKKAKEIYENHNFDGRTPATAFTTATNPFKHSSKETTPKTQKATPYRSSNMTTPNPVMMDYNPMMMMDYNSMMMMNPMSNYRGYNMMPRGGSGAGGGSGGGGASGTGSAGGNSGAGSMSGSGMYINPKFNWSNSPSS